MIKNNFRLIATYTMTPAHETNRLSFMYERKISMPISIVSHAGMGLVVDKFGEGSSIYRISMHVYGSLEARYYLFQKRRVRKGRAISGYQGLYAGLEQNVFSNAVMVDNIERRDALIGNSRSFINLGFQGQKKRFYANAHFGASFWRREFKKFSYPTNTIEPLHAGLSIGYVFGTGKL